MNSFACGWRDGMEQWSVLHDAAQGVDHIQTKGGLPPPFESIRQRLVAQQADRKDVDYIFDVPVELFTAMGGMRYDRELESGDRWQVLKRRDPPRRHRWFWPFR